MVKKKTSKKHPHLINPIINQPSFINYMCVYIHIYTVPYIYIYTSLNTYPVNVYMDVENQEIHNCRTPEKKRLQMVDVPHLWNPGVVFFQLLQLLHLPSPASRDRTTRTTPLLSSLWPLWLHLGRSPGPRSQTCGPGSRDITNTQVGKPQAWG